MRFLISIFILTLFTIETFAQKGNPIVPIDSVTGKISYTGVVIVDTSLNKQELFSRTREWFAKTYNSSTKVIQMEDKESGVIVGKALMQVYRKSLGSNYECGFINYTISVYFKDGRYKYEITDFYYTGPSDNPVIPDGACETWIYAKVKFPLMSQQAIKKILNYFLIQIDDNTKALIADLEKTLKLKSKSKPDW
jgi:hypothetical protein